MANGKWMTTIFQSWPDIRWGRRGTPELGQIVVTRVAVGRNPVVVGGSFVVG
ncbi:uncharacterized protein METZ01_LOCUS509821, partial [marine metagenome]